MTVNKLKTLMKKYNITRQELAEELGIHYSVLTKWLNGDRKPPAIAHRCIQLYEIAKDNKLI